MKNLTGAGTHAHIQLNLFGDSEVIVDSKKVSLEKKIERAIRLLQSADKKASRNGQPLEICYSGGKDSDVILELARMAGINFRAIYKNTTIDPPGTIKHARERGVEVMQPTMNFWQIIEKKGMPNRWRRFCCSVLKEYKVLDYIVVGIRRDESSARSKRYKEPEVCHVYNKKKGIKARKYMPILEWTQQDVGKFLTERGVKCHPLYYDKRGKIHTDRRLGCMCCPLLSRKKRIESFKEHPNMLRLYIKGGQTYLATHPNSKIGKIFNGNVYDWLASQIFCDGERQFREQFGPTIFDKGIDTKQFLEQQFNIKL